MPTPTTRLRTRLIDSGSELNTWGGNLNTQVFSLFDEAIAGVEKITLSASTYTLTSTNYVSDQARNAGLIFQGSPAASVAVTIPAVEKVYTVVNDTAQSITLGCGGTAASLAAGDRAVVWCDGTDCGLGSISVGTVNGLILAASLAPGTLPGQAGNAGKYLQTNGTAPLWSSISIPDVGGGADSTITTATALTSASSVVQSVDMATAAQSITLPDATTLTKGGRKFVILNTGNRTFGVRSNGGTLLTVVPAGASAELHLYSNGTAAGGWGVTGRGLEPALTLVDHTAPTTITSAVEMAVRLTDSLSIHFGTVASGFNALAVDNSTGTAGTWTAVEAGGAATVVHAFRMSDTTAIVFWRQAANHRACVLTVSGTAISVGSAATTATAFLDATEVSFTGRPRLAQLTASLYVGQYNTGSNAIAVSVSGTTVTIGSGVSLGAVAAVQGAIATYRVSDTTALALYEDNSGVAGSPYSVRGVVLSVSGTTITVGTSAGVNDVMNGNGGDFPSCQLTATKYLVGYNNGSGADASAVAVTVSGTTVTFGTPLSVETVAGTSVYSTSVNANRFQPNLFRLSDTTALFTWQENSAASRHVVLTESGGTVTKGTILYSLFTSSTGGNFPQAAGGFLAFSADQANGDVAVFGVTVSGTALAVTGTFSNGAVVLDSGSQYRFGLSGGVCGIRHQQSGTYGSQRQSLFHLFRFRANGSPQYLGPWSPNDFYVAALTPVEVAANKVAIIAAQGLTQPAASGNNVRLQIVEFAAL